MLDSRRLEGADDCAVVEIRQYTLFPGQRDVLIGLFDGYFVDGQTEDGMTVIGEFRVLDDPNRFFWIRGFPSMDARAKSLAAFYRGPLWKAHSNAANATMVDSDNVLLVRPAREGSGLPIMSDPGPNANAESRGLLVATMYHPEFPVGDVFVDLFEREIRPIVTRAGARVIGSYVTEESPNNYPSLPIRNVQTFAWFASFADLAAYTRYREDGDRRSWLDRGRSTICGT